MGISNKVVTIVLFCSGTSKEYLDNAPESEYNKNIGIGIAAILTGIFASLSGAYVVHIIFQSIFISTPVGFIWGFMIVNINRTLISIITWYDRPHRNLLRAVPGLLFAMIVGIVIAYPITLRLFANEINNHFTSKYKIAKLQEENIKKAIDEKKKEIANYNTELKRFEISLEKIREQMRCELDGTCGSMQFGTGEAYKAKEELYEKEKHERDKFIKDNKNEIRLIKNEIASLQTESYRIATKDAEKNRPFSFFEQLTVLSELSSKDDNVRLIILYIAGLFIILEMLPIVVILMSPRRSYYLRSKYKNAVGIQSNKKENNHTN